MRGAASRSTCLNEGEQRRVGEREGSVRGVASMQEYLLSPHLNDKCLILEVV